MEDSRRQQTEFSNLEYDVSKIERKQEAITSRLDEIMNLLQKSLTESREPDSKRRHRSKSPKSESPRERRPSRSSRSKSLDRKRPRIIDHRRSKIEKEPSRLSQEEPSTSRKVRLLPETLVEKPRLKKVPSLASTAKSSKNQRLVQFRDKEESSESSRPNASNNTSPESSPTNRCSKKPSRGESIRKETSRGNRPDSSNSREISEVVDVESSSDDDLVEVPVTASLKFC